MSLSGYKVPGMWPSDEPTPQFDPVDFDFFLDNAIYGPEPEIKSEEFMLIPLYKPKSSDDAASGTNPQYVSLQDIEYQPLGQQVFESPVKSSTDVSQELNNVEFFEFANGGVAHCEDLFGGYACFAGALQDDDHHEDHSSLLENSEQYAAEDVEHVQAAFGKDLEGIEGKFGDSSSAADTLQDDDQYSSHGSLLTNGEQHAVGVDEHAQAVIDQDLYESDSYLEDLASAADHPSVIFIDDEGSSSEDNEVDEVSSVISYDEDAALPIAGSEVDGDDSRSVVSVLNDSSSEDVIPSVEIPGFDDDDGNKYDLSARSRSSSPEEPVERKTYGDKSVNWSSEQGRNRYGIHWRRYLSPSKSETPEIKEEVLLDETPSDDDANDSSYEEEPSSDDELEPFPEYVEPDPKEYASESSPEVEEPVSPATAPSQPVTHTQYSGKYPRKGPYQTPQDIPSSTLSGTSPLPTTQSTSSRKYPQKYPRKAPYQHAPPKSSREACTQVASDFGDGISIEERVKLRRGQTANNFSTPSTKKRSRDDEDLDDAGYQSPTPQRKKAKQEAVKPSVKKSSPANKAAPSKKRARDVEDDDFDADLAHQNPKKQKKEKKNGGYFHSSDKWKKPTKPVRGRPAIRDLPPTPAVQPTKPVALTASKKPQKPSWTSEEHAALFFCLVEFRNWENENDYQPINDTKLFDHMSHLLERYNIHRPGNGCKTQWNRYVRDKYRYEERVYEGPQLPWITCNQKGKKQKKQKEKKEKEKEKKEKEKKVKKVKKVKKMKKVKNT